MRFLLDEHLSRRVAQGLRQRQTDAVGLTESSYRHLLGKPDEEILEAAAAEGRAVVTHDVADFTDLHRDWILTNRRHAGIVLVSGRFRVGSGELVKALQKLAQSREGLDEQIVWLQP